jgi:hypothetical protein
MVIARVIRTFNRYREVFGDDWTFTLSYSASRKEWVCSLYRLVEGRAANVILDRRGRYRKAGGPQTSFVSRLTEGSGPTAIEAAEPVADKMVEQLNAAWARKHK